MAQAESSPSSNEEPAIAALSEDNEVEQQGKTEEIPADKEEATSQHSDSEPKEAPVPKDKVHLNLLLVSGKRMFIEVTKADTISHIKALVLKQWPTEWNKSKPNSVDEMNVIYLGKFLANESTLEANNIRSGRVTTVHLNINTGTKWKGEGKH
ncbi:Ubiquitin-like protein 3, variant 2 [Umbelopsis sp. WA50703]